MIPRTGQRADLGGLAQIRPRVLSPQTGICHPFHLESDFCLLACLGLGSTPAGGEVRACSWLSAQASVPRIKPKWFIRKGLTPPPSQGNLFVFIAEFGAPTALLVCAIVLCQPPILSHHSGYRVGTLLPRALGLPPSSLSCLLIFVVMP